MVDQSGTAQIFQEASTKRCRAKTRQDVPHEKETKKHKERGINKGGGDQTNSRAREVEKGLELKI